MPDAAHAFAGLTAPEPAAIRFVAPGSPSTAGRRVQPRVEGNGPLSDDTRFFLRLLLYLFTIFGLFVALPLVVWDIASRLVFLPVATLLTFLSAFVPIGVIAVLNIEGDPDDGDVPYRIREDQTVRASILAGLVLGTGAMIWLIA